MDWINLLCRYWDMGGRGVPNLVGTAERLLFVYGTPPPVVPLWLLRFSTSLLGLGYFDTSTEHGCARAHTLINIAIDRDH